MDLIRGGQGRSADSVMWSAAISFTAILVVSLFVLALRIFKE